MTPAAFSERLRGLNRAVQETRDRTPDATGMVARDERFVRDTPGAVRVDSAGYATIHFSPTRQVPGGRFRLLSTAELLPLVRPNGRPNRLIVVDGASAATDIGAMQAGGGCSRAHPHNPPQPPRLSRGRSG